MTDDDAAGLPAEFGSAERRQAMLADQMFVSIDVEMDGPCAGLNSMLSWGAAAFDLRRGVLGVEDCNLELLEGAEPHPKTEEFWNKTDANRRAYAATRVDPVNPRAAMVKLAKFARRHADGRRAVFAGYPASYDFSQVNYYFHRFLGENPFGWQAFDFKSGVMMALKIPFLQVSKRRFPKKWRPTGPRGGHVAKYDALNQAEQMIHMLCEHFGLPDPVPPRDVAA